MRLKVFTLCAPLFAMPHSPPLNPCAEQRPQLRAFACVRRDAPRALHPGQSRSCPRKNKRTCLFVLLTFLCGFQFLLEVEGDIIAPAIFPRSGGRWNGRRCQFPFQQSGSLVAFHLHAHRRRFVIKTQTECDCQIFSRATDFCFGKARAIKQFV